MDLYGLIGFIDETLLPGEKEFLVRYLRRPENYPELSEQVSRYCFRTLRSQAKHYAKVTERVLLTVEYTPGKAERQLYELLYAYINQPEKKAFPEMNQYDLALRLLGLVGSSTAAILQTIKGIVKRLQGLENAAEELPQWQEIQTVAESIPQDAKAGELLTVLKQGFSLMKKTGAKQKAVIFTESVETQKMLQHLLSGQYRTLAYNGSADYSVIRQFKEDGDVLISTDNGAKGFNLEEAAFIIHYDLPYNTLKLEQRIDRCHRLGQENDVLSVAFIDKNNFADVRKLELVNKRMLVTDGVFGITDDVLGGFTDDVKAAFPVIAQRLRPRAQIEQAYRQTLSTHEEDNRQTVSAAEDILFTTNALALAIDPPCDEQDIRLEGVAGVDNSEALHVVHRRRACQHFNVTAIAAASIVVEHPRRFRKLSHGTASSLNQHQNQKVQPACEQSDNPAAVQQSSPLHTGADVIPQDLQEIHK